MQYYFTYVLQSESDKLFYTGYTKDKSFVSKLNDSEGEAGETQVWLDYALACEYIEKSEHEALYEP